MKPLVVVPVYNEEERLEETLRRLAPLGIDIAAVDDGSRDGSPAILDRAPCVRVIRHETNLGYGQALIDAFAFAEREGYDAVVTVDADNQHDPEKIPLLLDRLDDADVVSGTRYPHGWDDPRRVAPPARLGINRAITALVREHTGYAITDAFCGFKAYRTEPLRSLDLEEPGYGLCLEFWIMAAQAGLFVLEEPVRRIYHDANRTFGPLDDPDVRLAYYHDVMRRAIERTGTTCFTCELCTGGTQCVCV